MLVSFLKNLTAYGIRYSLIILLLIIWQLVIGFGLLPDYLLPSPMQIIKAFIDDFYLLMSHAKYTLITAFLGTIIGLILSFVLSILMDLSKNFRQMVYPILLLNQNHSYHCHCPFTCDLAWLWHIAKSGAGGIVGIFSDDDCTCGRL